MISSRISLTQAPPLVGLGSLASNTEGCISLGQGAPYYRLPNTIFDSIGEDLVEDSIHRYTPDPGRLDFRTRLSEKIREDNGITISPNSIVVTPGANQAFYNILLTITDPMDEVILLGPYYFNHQMACSLSGVKTIEVPLATDFSIPSGLLEEAITKQTKAIVFVNPGNPTGAVHSKHDIDVLRDLSEENNIWIIADETYEYFTYSGTEHIPAASVLDQHVISIGSFSKTYGIPGWRLGYYFGPDEMIDQSIKVQDTIGICAPNPSQVLGMKLLAQRKEIIPEFVSLMEDNHSLATDLIEEIPWLHNQPSNGAYYLFPSQSTDIPSMKLSRDLIKNNKVYIVPGDGFGKSGTNHFRISFANVTDEGLKEAFARLRSFSP